MVLKQNRHSIYNYFCCSIKKKNLVVRDGIEKIIYVFTQYKQKTDLAETKWEMENMRKYVTEITSWGVT